MNHKLPSEKDIIREGREHEEVILGTPFIPTFIYAQAIKRTRTATRDAVLGEIATVAKIYETSSSCRNALDDLKARITTIFHDQTGA